MSKPSLMPPIVGETEASFDLRLTATESEQLMALLDLAVKSGGIRVAQAGLFFAQRIQEGLRSAIVPSSSVPR